MGSGAEEPNSIVQLGRGPKTTPNLRATQVELYDGLTARSVSGWPSVRFDIYALTGLLGRLLPAGFYYKTFMRPRFLWDWYERQIRKAAGLGRAPTEGDLDHYDKFNIHCDVLVVGGGPTGLMAALAAGRAGARVILADEQAEMGGSLLSSTGLIGGKKPTDWITQVVSELTRMSEVILLPRSTVTGYYDHNFLVINERRTDHLEQPDPRFSRERIWRVRASQVVLATGAIERPLVFSNNDKPGVMLASAVSAYLIRYGVLPGRNIVFFTNNDSIYRTVLQVVNAGVEVVGVVDVRSNIHGDLIQAVRSAGVPIFEEHVVIDVRGGVNGLSMASIARVNRTLDEILSHKGELRCDTLAVSGGWNPVVHLHAQSGGKPVFDEECASFTPGRSVQRERSAGTANGTFGFADCLREGMEVGRRAAKDAGLTGDGIVDIPNVETTLEGSLNPIWVVPNGLGEGRGGKKFVDLQNDTTVADIFLAVREGYRSIEHLKRYTALGFGTDQGKLGNINGLGILAEVLGETPGETGTTTFRPNYTPVTFGAIAGREIGPTFFDLVRKTAVHEWHVERGAEFEDVGQWKRPWYYPLLGETINDAVQRECLATRESLGVLDASTLGKIEIRGTDAAEFLNRIYTNSWSKLEIGRCRYGLMLGEDGMVMDDGVTSRIGEDHYLMTTTTGGAAHVLAWMERWLQTEWPHLKVYLTSVTDHWSVTSVAGPNSREVISRLCDDIDFSPDAFPFMSFHEGTVAGIPARVYRISFSGELAYEINVSANFGQSLWEEVMTAGQSFSITPYGTEAMHVLRAEKGYIIVGQDTDGSVTPGDLGMDWIVSNTKDCIGKRSLFRQDTQRENRKQLVGLTTIDPALVLPEGAQLLNEPTIEFPASMVGHVTSSYFSPSLQRSIALALVKGGRSREGSVIYAQLMDGRVIPATIGQSKFYDLENQRQKM
jgi:sarcosine oxidase subunit alpha